MRGKKSTGNQEPTMLTIDYGCDDEKKNLELGQHFGTIA
jgi:hypothetical protein